MRRLLLVCAALLIACDFIRAQSDSQQTFNISGTVVNSVNGEPVRGAMVYLVTSGTKSVLSGADGRFVIDGVTAGYANISARRPGYDSEYRHQQRIKIDSSTDGIVVKLSPLAKISGRVMDRDGEPIEGIAIQCLRGTIINGRKIWQPHGGANTDEGGYFSLEDLNPGTYIVGTQQKQLYSVAKRSEAARYVYPATFYPDAATSDSAQRIVLAPGEEAKADMDLNTVRGARISLTTVPPSDNVIATISLDSEGFTNMPFQADRSGSTIFGGVPPGSWKIVVRGPFSSERKAGAEAMYGEMEIEVGTADIENLKIPLANLADIPVKVTGVQNTHTTVQLIAKTGMLIGMEQPDSNGDGKIRAVPPGSYRVVVPDSRSNTCVTSMMSGSVDLVHEELTVTAGSAVAPIQLVQSDNCAQLTINTNVKGASLLIAGESKIFPPLVLYGVDSSYTATGLREGDYRVYAFDDISDLEYANPEVMRPFKAQTVHLEAGQKATVQISEVNERHTSGDQP